MSFAVIHMKKLKGPDVKGIQIHNQREKESHSNFDIDKDRTYLNYDLLNDSKINYTDRIQKEINERYTGTKKIRRDAVKLCSFLVTSDKSFFDGLPPEEEKRYFQEALGFLQDRYGKENILYAMVHKDEKTPHMHVGMVPITPDGKLAAKAFFGKRSELQQLQDQFHEHIVKAGFSLERGISSDKKHVEPKRFKAMSVREEIQSLEGQLQEKQEQKQQIDSSIKEIKGRLSDLEGDLSGITKHGLMIDQIETKKPLTSRDSVLIKQDDFIQLQHTAKKVPLLERQVIQVNNENQHLTQKISGLDSENRQLRQENKELKAENSKLKAMLEKVQTFFRENQLFSPFNEFLHKFSKNKEKQSEIER
ncbi:plasmid recombination protein [Bacillus salipaludis]|uniref:Plasmid recombination protein n=1 Tax=Bacillus salipaludis TaxID=2547811 RepID=A0A4R5VHY9_9BACI|nr:MobV family relaxase [Bacillus salipaludis]TDK54766.1 plasmid recombination protein [Bacillus salipaludis]